MTYATAVPVVRLQFSDGFRYYGDSTSLSAQATVNLPVVNVNHTGTGESLADGQVLPPQDIAAFDVPNPRTQGWTTPEGNHIVGWSYDLAVTITASGQPPLLWSATVSPYDATEVITPGMGNLIGAAQEGATASVVDGRAAQADYVDILESASPLTGVQVVKTDAGESLQVVSYSRSGQYTVHLIEGNAATSGRDDYRIIGDIYTGQLPDDETVFADATTTGTYSINPGAAAYTTQVGATWEVPIDVGFTGQDVRVYTYKDDRGGVWRYTFAGQTRDVSTWSASAYYDVTGVPVSAKTVTPGRYTLRAEFMGDDPLHVPSNGAGNARGWLPRTPGTDGSNWSDHLVLTPDTSAGWPLTTKVGVESNREFAWTFKPSGSTLGTSWFPYHGTKTAFAAEPVEFYDGSRAFRVDGVNVPVGARIDLSGPFRMVQHVYGRHPATSTTTNYLEAWTTTTVHPSGRVTVEGRIKALADVETGLGQYVLMAPVSAPLFDLVVSPWGNAYPDTAAELGTNTYLPESDVGASYAFLSSTSPDVAAAFRYNNPVETTRRGGADKVSQDRRAWLEHRSGGEILKHYQRLYATGAVIPAGASHRFSGDYIHGVFPNAYGQYAL